MKHVILGGGGWVAGVLAREIPGVTLVSRSQCDYTRCSELDGLLSDLRKDGGIILINAAGVTGKPNVDGCERNKNECALGNIAFPVMVATLCAATGIRWVNIGSGCIYSGHKQRGPGGVVIGYSEEDEPNFTFDDRSSFYSASKAVSDAMLQKVPYGWNLRIRMPFDSVHHPKNLITKLTNYPKLVDGNNSLTCLVDLAGIIIKLPEKAPFGTYNAVNESWISTREIVQIMEQNNVITRTPEWFSNNGEFLRTVTTPRSNCILEASKLRTFGFEIRNVSNALSECCYALRAV